MPRSVATSLVVHQSRGRRPHLRVRPHPDRPEGTRGHITKHDRPHHAKLQAEDGTTITYTFIGKGDDTFFRREFERHLPPRELPVAADGHGPGH